MDNASGQDGRILPHLSGHSALPAAAAAAAAGRMMLPPLSLPKRKTKNVVTAEDYEQLRKHYTFVLPDKSQRDSTWQERMVRQYHSHLQKEFALADFSTPGKIGFCFRTKEEVVSGLGFRTCGNLQCPSFQQPELYINRKMAAQNNQLTSQGFPGPPYGEGLQDYEVPFQYMEHGETKMELVKVRLCKVCIPKLMDRSPGGGNKKIPASKRQEINSKPGSGDAKQSTSDSTSSSDGKSTSSSSADETAAFEDSTRQSTKRKRKGKEKPRKCHTSKPTKSTDDNGSTSSSNSSQEMGENGDNSGKQEGKADANSSRQQRKERHKRERKRHKHKKKHKDT